MTKTVIFAAFARMTVFVISAAREPVHNEIRPHRRISEVPPAVSLASPASHRRRPTVVVLAALGLAALLLTGPGRVDTTAEPTAPDDFARAAERIDRSGVGLVVEDGAGRREWGAGFAWRRGGLVVTAAHVVRAARRVAARLPDGREVAAEIVGADDLSDVALLRLPVDLPPVAIGTPPRRGAAVGALGDPLGFAATLTVGHVSTPARPWAETIPWDVIQHDAALNPGSSGGPLIDRTGRVVGMNVAIADGSRRNVGIGLAVPIDLVDRIADRLAREPTPTRPRLGVRLRDTAALRGAIPALTGPGAMVEAVEPGAPAAVAGLAAGQIVVAADGRPVHGVRDLARALEPKRPGDPMRLVVMVGDDVRPLDFTLDAAPPRPVPPAPDPAAPLGLDLDADASPRVRTIAAGSLAADAGLAVGDEILSVGLGRADPDRLAEASGAARDGVALLVRRGDHTRWVVLGPHGRLDGDAPFGSNAEAATSHTL